MKNFLLTLAIEGLEDKYNILLSRGKHYTLYTRMNVFFESQ